MRWPLSVMVHAATGAGVEGEEMSSGWLKRIPKIVRRLIISALVLIVGLIAILLIVINFSAATTFLKCEGEISIEGQTHPSKLYAELNEYRWWVGLWSNSDGAIKIELPDHGFRYFPNIRDTGWLLNIYLLNIQEGHKGELDLIGAYSKMSKTLKLKTGYGFFEGACKGRCHVNQIYYEFTATRLWSP